MALSMVSYPGDGVTSTFTLNFALGVLDRADVTCQVVKDTSIISNIGNREIEWIDDNFVRILGPAPAVGEHAVFTRSVPKDELVVDYEDGAIQTEENLNTSQKQLLMAVHEVFDGRTTSMDSIRSVLKYLSDRVVYLESRIGSEELKTYDFGSVTVDAVFLMPDWGFITDAVVNPDQPSDIPPDLECNSDAGVY